MISIIIPCYSTSQNNHGQFVKRAVHSALQQTYKDKEIIIVDDGSPQPVINIWGNPVRVIRHEINRGLSAALNTGIHASNGDRFIILAADDELRADCLEKLSQRTADVVCSDFRGDQGAPVKCKPADLHTLVNVGNCHSYAALIKKSAWEKTGGFKHYMNPSQEDYEMFINLAKHKASWDYVPEALHIYHRNAAGRDVDAQTKERLLKGKLYGAHQDLFGKGKGVVAFIIPCFKHEKFLPEALQSIQAQIYPHCVVVVVDDGSPGNVLKAIKQSNVSGVHLVRQHNKHLSAARNTGIKYVMEVFNPEYMVMLDADDTVEPNFVEDLMIDMTGNREYVYADIKFIGDAWHQYHLHEYSCKELTRKHLHPCTFLAQSAMFSEVGKRGYIYDEQMKKGYEDWEFALATLKAGWCGKRHPKPLFHYRYHNGGSMRMDAMDINDELAAYIKSRHPWTQNQEAIDMACTTCGDRKVYTTRVVNKNGGIAFMLSVPGVGQVDAREPLQVTYTGSTTNVITKIGTGGTIYKYSADPHRMVDGRIIHNRFTAFGRDAHLFVGPFNIERVQAPVAEIAAVTAPQPIPVKVEIAREPTEAERLVTKFEEREKKVVVTTAFDPDDFTTLLGEDGKKLLNNAGAKKLQEAGFAYFSDVADASVDEAALVLKTSKVKAQVLIDAAAAKR